MKEKEKSPKKELNEMEMSNLSDTELKVIVIRMLNTMKKNIEIIKKDQPEVKNTLSELKNILEGMNSMLDETEDSISNLEDRIKKTCNLSSKKKKNKIKMKMI